MPQERADPGKHAVPRRQPLDQQYGDQPFGEIEQQRRGGEPLAPRPQHIGRADVARSDPAQVSRATEPCQDHPERNRAEQVSERQRKHRRDPEDFRAQPVSSPPQAVLG